MSLPKKRVCYYYDSKYKKKRKQCFTIKNILGYIWSELVCPSLYLIAIHTLFFIFFDSLVCRFVLHFNDEIYNKIKLI